MKSTLAALLAVAIGLLLLCLSVCAYWGIRAWQEWLVYEQYGVAGPRLVGVVSAIGRPTTLTGTYLPGGGVSLKPLGDFRWGKGANTFCELYVEQITGIGNQGLTAALAAQRFADLGLLHRGTPPAGAIVYFGPSPDNEGMGHTGIAEGGGQFRSITVDGLAVASLAGWRAPYLGYVLPASVKSDRFGHVARAA